MRLHRSGWAVATALVAVGALALAGCKGGSDEPSKPGGPVELKIAFWGHFGLDELKAKYESANPNVKIVLNSGEYTAQHEDLQKKLIAGSGAPDIAAIDEGFIVSF